jgi:flagellar FliL protein
MSNAAAAADAPPPAKSKKPLIIIIIAAVVVLALVGVGAMLLLKKKPAEEGEDGEASAKSAAAPVKHDPKAVPIFVPLDVFVVNIADKDADRYAQVGMTLEISDAKLGDQIKAFMPAIRHAVLMVLADKTAAQLIDREGKLKLARAVQRETSRVLGAEVGDEDEEEAEPPVADKKDPKKGKKKKGRVVVELPIRAVHFSSFIVQ